ncbi:MAG: gliding motility-associated C-terminal domain-containing protein [Chitinophagaceae bacterium]|nr:gliding motility-associated C-terminal domain-containing protein [Chitinophagaceae bacterium]
MKTSTLVFCIITMLTFQSFGQCGITINTFPYIQGFETNTGNWVSGGTANDWAWGAPNKGYIQTAGGGNKCFVTGGLNGNTYNLGEKSYVTSPCFDFTNLTYPHISFKIYWESEESFDGTCFQYSTNNGSTWLNVGTSSDPVNCLNQNWFNSSNITYLSTLANPKQGWSGSQFSSGSCSSGNGSNGWVTASHCLSNLAGLPSVQFRFAFGAGTFCNDFDGVAFDDIKIENAPPNDANFSYNCTNAVLGYQFNNTSTMCPDVYTWNFGDPASGANNFSNAANPNHIFSAPGTYQVSLTTSGPCNAPSTMTKTITTISALFQSTTPTCNGGLGSITMTASTVNFGLNYLLLPNNTTNTTGSFTGLTAGNYTVSATDAGNCSITSVININPNTPIIWTNFIIKQIDCNGANDGKIEALANGGNGTFTYNLQPGNVTITNGLFQSLIPGTYTVTATDANSCTLTSLVNITEPPLITQVSLTSDNVLCHGGNSGKIVALFTGGNSSIVYTLLPQGSANNNGVFTGLLAGIYTVVASDANNCFKTTVINLTEPPSLVVDAINIIQPDCNPNNNGKITVMASGGTSPYQFSLGTTFFNSNLFTGLTSNTYTVTVKDANNCSITSSATLLSKDAPIFNQPITQATSCIQSTDGKLEITATSTAGITGYAISPGGSSSVNGLFNNLAAGIYTITATDATLCSNTTAITIASPEAIIITNITFTNDSCGNNTNKLQVTAIGGTGSKTFTMQPGNYNSPTGYFQQLKAGKYFITAIDANQCTATNQVTIPEKNCCSELFIPSAFSPNQDLLNDELKIVNAYGIELKDFMIFNRWGSVIFKTNVVENSWDGKYKTTPAEIGTYFYLIKYKCLADGLEHTLKGDFLLIR